MYLSGLGFTIARPNVRPNGHGSIYAAGKGERTGSAPYRPPSPRPAPRPAPRPSPTAPSTPLTPYRPTHPKTGDPLPRPGTPGGGLTKPPTSGTSSMPSSLPTVSRTVIQSGAKATKAAETGGSAIPWLIALAAGYFIA